MDLPDVNVKVLYNFEYTTKDGREVRIIEGEKLYLLKKTNDDWWQVIRNSGRPFYVPASYVQEIHKGDSTIENNTSEKNLACAENYRNRSCSVESQKTHETHKYKPAVPKRTIFGKIPPPSDNKLQPKKSEGMTFSNPKNFNIREENFPDQNDDDEEADYVNIPKNEPKQNSVVAKNGEISTHSKISNSKPSLAGRTYSQVNITRSTLPSVAKSSSAQMNLSTSLEELSKEINQKTATIGSIKRGTNTKFSGYSRVGDIVKSITKDSVVPSKNLVPNHNLKNSNHNSADAESEPKNKLQYCGSFKTKHEREKWARNYVLLTSMKEEDSENVGNPAENETVLKTESINNKSTSNSSEAQFAGDKSPVNAKEVICSQEDKRHSECESERRSCKDVTSEYQNIIPIVTEVTQKSDRTNDNRKPSKKEPTFEVSETSGHKYAVVKKMDESNKTLQGSAKNVSEGNKMLQGSTKNVSETNKTLQDSSTNVSEANKMLQHSAKNVSEVKIENGSVKVDKTICQDGAKVENLREKNDLPGPRYATVSLRRSPNYIRTDQNRIHQYENRVVIETSLDSSMEELGKSSSLDNTRSSASEKGSIDSLLDVDENHLSMQDGSVGTNASDSLLISETSEEEEFSKILREKSEGQSEDCSKKKPILSRNARIESCRLRFPVRGVSPPVPEPDQKATKELFGGWSEYTFTDGRTFFYNCQTGEKSWKPPRRRSGNSEKGRSRGGSLGNVYSGSSSPLAGIEETPAGIQVDSGEAKINSETSGAASPVTNSTRTAATTTRNGVLPNNRSPTETPFLSLPAGWQSYTDPANGSHYYVNSQTGAKWLSSNDEEGRIYYFEENSNESSWTLPSTKLSSNEKLDGNITTGSQEDAASRSCSPVYSNLPPIVRSCTTASVPVSISVEEFSDNTAYSQNRSEDSQPSFGSKNWPQLWDGHMCVLKEGTLNKTKITENGKRLRKNWTSSHVVLTELFLLFFKDAKAFSAMKTGSGRPEMCVDLNGALIDRGDKVSSRKNVYIISTVLGLQVLIQNDCTQQADTWLLAIQGAIKNLPSGFDSCPRITRGTSERETISLDTETVSKKFYKVTRTKSVKNEPAFGCFLEQVCPAESPRVPLFVQKCIACIEKSEENMKTDGLYRASGNLSQVQKIRLQVDQNNLTVIDDEEDVHVLTGALKLFFRELKEPLIPYHAFHKAIKASNNHNRKEKITQFRDIAKSLPPANFDTLKYLLQHLLRVTKYKDHNRMHIPNLAIVFGPTLMWPEQESMNMALDLMQQNLVIECFLLEFDHIFK